MKGVILKQILEDGVTRLLATGLDVRAVVADQGSNNRKAFALLGVTESRPFFSFTGTSGLVYI